MENSFHKDTRTCFASCVFPGPLYQGHSPSHHCGHHCNWYSRFYAELPLHGSWVEMHTLPGPSYSVQLLCHIHLNLQYLVEIHKSIGAVISCEARRRQVTMYWLHAVRTARGPLRMVQEAVQPMTSCRKSICLAVPSITTPHLAATLSYYYTFMMGKFVFLS